MCFLNFWFVIKNKKQCRSEAAFPHSRCFSSCFQKLADKESLEEGLLYRYVEDLVGFVSRSAVLWCHSGVLCSLSPAHSFLWNKRHKIPPKVSSKCTLPWILRFVSLVVSYLFDPSSTVRIQLPAWDHSSLSRLYLHLLLSAHQQNIWSKYLFPLW